MFYPGREKITFTDLEDELVSEREGKSIPPPASLSPVKSTPPPETMLNKDNTE